MPYIKRLCRTIPILIVLSGCSSIDRDVLIEGIKETPDSGSYIEGVPFFPQERFQCGPSSLASLLAFYGETVDKEEIAGGVYLPRLRGALPMDIVLYARKKGYISRYYNGGMDDLKTQISLGRPLILFLNMGLRIAPKGHYIVALGYSDMDSVVIAHSGRDKEAIFTYDMLEELWEKTGHGTILILPEGQ